MKFITIAMGVVFIFNLVLTPPLSYFLSFNRAAIFSGQVWRILTFLFIPLNSSPIFIIFTLYFYWMIGDALEREWGSKKFNLFYLSGVLGAIIAGLITGYSTNQYLNFSLFFAFALLYPDFQLLLFLVIPVKVKWLALLNALFFLFELIFSNWSNRLVLVLSLVNLLLFFNKNLRQQINAARRRRQWRNSFK